MTTTRKPHPEDDEAFDMWNERHGRGEEDYREEPDFDVIDNDYDDDYDEG